MCFIILFFNLFIIVGIVQKYKIKCLKTNLKNGKEEKNYEN